MHSHPAISLLLTRAKAPEKIILVSDSMEATGCADGMYTISHLPVVVKGGMALTEDGKLAGSTLTLIDGVANFMKFTGKTLEEVLPAATENPARMLGISDRVGSVAAGKRADFLLIENKNVPTLRFAVCGGITLNH